MFSRDFEIFNILEQNLGHFLSEFNFFICHCRIESIVAAADQNMYEYKRNYYISQGIDRRRR